MRIKNISSTPVDIPELDLQLSPGDEGDLSAFDPKEIHQNKKLQAFFQKGLLLNLGNRGITNKGTLQAARARIAKMGLSDFVPVSAKKTSTKKTNRKKISDMMRDNKRESQVETERYAEDKKRSRELMSMFDDEDAEERDYYQKIENTPRSMQIDSNGIISEFGADGIIESSILAENTTMLSADTTRVVKKEDPDYLAIQDSAGNTYQVSLNAIAERISSQCTGTTAKGRLCKKRAILGFMSCKTHMTLSEKKEYKKLKVK